MFHDSNYRRATQDDVRSFANRVTTATVVLYVTVNLHLIHACSEYIEYNRFLLLNKYKKYVIYIHVSRLSYTCIFPRVRNNKKDHRLFTDHLFQRFQKVCSRKTTTYFEKYFYYILL